MSTSPKSLRGISFLIADSNTYFSSVLFSMLKGFGADKIIQSRERGAAIEALTNSKIDVMLCDALFPPGGGVSFVRGLRGDAKAPYRKIPILFMTSDGRVSTTKEARDAGANMVIMKPLSPKSLFERLVWVAYDARAFVETPTYCGPDRRFRIEGFSSGKGRRKSDRPAGAAEGGDMASSPKDAEPALADAHGS